MKLRRSKRIFSSARVIILGFLIMIMAGSLLLMLPIATRDREGASFFDALFTATSAVCVTGLVVRDTATYWSAFGQSVILALIQIGGMGVITVAVSLTMLSGKKIGLMQRSTMQESISAPKVAGIVKLTGFIVRGAFIIEALGAAAMLPVFIKAFGPLKGLWYAVFHSVSAFCNAGFDLMGESGKFSSLTYFSDSLLINIAVMLLIIIGGIGFLTWEDIKTNKLKIRRYRMQSKVILAFSAVLILVPTVFFWFNEFAGLPVGKRALYSIYQSVSPRTAGFNTADLSAMSQAGQVVIIILMLIGGSPGSTAGGMKTTTAAVLLLSAFAVFKRKSETNVFGRRISDETIRQAAAVLLMYMVLFVTGGIAVSCIEGLPMLTSLFETASAVGTVGLTLGVTPTLTQASRLILIALMYFGRVGGLTIVFAAVSDINRNVYKLPMEKITVG